jgi:hypothetical protein
MLILITREPRADAPYWRGRRLLAAVDALVWPLAWVLLVGQIPAGAGLLRPVAVVAALCAISRLYGAVLVNHRYRFTTWRCLRFVALLLSVWIVLKLALPA